MDDLLLVADEVATLIRCSKLTIYGMVSKRKIPFIKLSRRLLRFRKSEIMDWIEGGAKGIEGKNLDNKRKRRMKTSGTGNNIRGIVKKAKKDVMGS